MIFGLLRQGFTIDAQKPSNVCIAEANGTGSSVVHAYMDSLALRRAENPLEHIEEMNANVGGNTSTLFLISFPRGIIPVASRGDVREVRVENIIRICIQFLLHLLLKGNDLLVKT